MITFESLSSCFGIKFSEDVEFNVLPYCVRIHFEVGSPFI
jgi:hypothetical protein